MKRIAITIKPTNDCNMRCKHCYHAEEGYDSEQLDPIQVKRMLDIAVKEYDRIKIVFHGGEPTLWGVDNIVSILEYEKYLEKEKNVKFENSIQSNGLLIDDIWIEKLRNYPIIIGISYDGPHNDILRSHSQRVYENLVKLKNANMNFGIICVESSKSISDLKNTYEWFKKEGFTFKILALFMSGAAIEHGELELNIQEYVKNLTDVYQYWLYDKECNIEMVTFQDLLKVADKLYCLQYGGSCIYNRIALNPNGNIYPCGRPYSDDFILGNIKDLTLISDAFNTAAYQNLVKISNERTRQCESRCKYFGVCRGGCVSSAILEGSFEKIDNISCRRAKSLLNRVTEINNDIYSKFDSKVGLDELNPIALDIMKNVRGGKYEFTHFSRQENKRQS